MVKDLENSFKNIFDQFYQRSACKDRLEGLTDQEIINNIHASPNKIKRQNKSVMEYLKKNAKVSLDEFGNVKVDGNIQKELEEFVKVSPEIKIALLNENLNYERPNQYKRQH